MSDNVRQVSEALRQSEERYRALFKGMIEGFALHEVICDGQGQPCDYRFLEVNPAFERLTGLKREAVVGKTVKGVLPNDDPKWVKLYGEVALTGEPAHFENYSPALQRHFEVFAYRPAPRQFAVVFRDITAHKRMDESLVQERGNLQAIFDAANVGMLLIDAKGVVKRVNRTITRWIGKEHAASPEAQPGDLLGCVHALSDAVGCGHTEHCVSCPIRGTFESVLRSGKAVRGVEAEAAILVDGKEVRLWLETSADPLVMDRERCVLLTLSDITRRKQAEEALQQLAAIVTSSEDAIIGKTLDGVIRTWNAGAERMYGYTAEEAIGRSISMLVPPDRLGEESVLLEKVRKGEPVKQYEAERIRKDGGRVPVALTLSPVKDSEGRIVGASTIAHDITERRRAQAETAWLASFPELNPRCVAEVDLEGHVRYLNPSGRRMFPELEQQGPAHPWLADWSAVGATLRQSGAHALVRDVAVGDRWHQQAMHYVAGTQCVRIYSVDITEQRRVQQEREITLEFLHLVNESSGTKQLTRSAAAFFQQHSGCQAVGIRLKEGDDYPYAEARGFPPEFIAMENNLCVRDDAGQAIRDGAGNPVIDGLCGNVICGRFDPSKPFFSPRGSFWTNSFSELLGSATDADLQTRTRKRCKLVGYESAALIALRLGDRRLGLLQLNDPRKGLFSREAIRLWEGLADHLAVALAKFSAEETLKRTADELARSNEELRHFAYVASHDLQEPLRVVTGYLQLLERRYKEKLDANADKFINFAVEGAAHMEQLINDLLTYSRVSSAVKPFRPTDMQKVLDKVLVILQHSISPSGAVITADPLPTVSADETQMTQLLQNLISNAIKFRSDRRPEVHISACQNGERWEFCVRDNGIGIEDQYWEQIFVIFRRLHTREKYPGTGIGLAICKKIVERHGGRIWVVSTPGQGTTFYFTI